MKQGRQTTLRDTVTVTGVGVHSGSAARLTLHPAEIDTGIVFLRGCPNGGPDREITVSPASVKATALATVLGDESGPAVSTVEHILAALSGLGIDNVIVEVDGPEVPILDGSAQPFVTAIDSVGTATQTAIRRCIKVLRPVKVRQDRAFAELKPHAAGLSLHVEIDFDHALIGRQAFAGLVDPIMFRRDLSRARTFGFMRDVSKLWSAGYALGASLDNTIVVGDDRLLNAGGLRYADEFVRHKALDAVGDLALAGAPILGAFSSYCGGHRINHALVAELFSSARNYAIVDMPARRERGHGEAPRLQAAAMRADAG